jgi:hypothetical protein
MLFDHSQKKGRLDMPRLPSGRREKDPVHSSRVKDGYSAGFALNKSEAGAYSCVEPAEDMQQSDSSLWLPDDVLAHINEER